ncbi:Homeodomain 1 [Mycena venus]|uniref:Homeodomain 1 n=1 Tax=Mycena venus TaxID=2733690 RepID=A0A8H6XWH9_9AGAR|nr:Homeodomain 1 [Mycena venus]
MSSPTIHQRLLDIRGEFLGVFTTDNHDAAAALSLKWAHTVTLAHTLASEIAILSGSLISIRTGSTDIATELTKDLENVFDDLDLEGQTTPASDDDSSIPHMRPDPSLPPYIEPAYKWLLKHLHNPYPKKEIKEKIADQTGSSIERISDWFVDVRRRMGWTILLREEFGRKRVDLIDAARRYYIHPNRRYPLPAYIHGKFVEMEAFAHDMYAAKFVPSALSNKLTAAVKDLTPELQEKARQERLKKAQADKEAAKLGIYPSPPASGASSPISDPGASTSYAGHKRSHSESSDDDYSANKRSRTDGASTLPSPSLLWLLRARTNRAASDPIPVTVTLTGTPDILADWFSSDRGDTNLFEPGQLLDIKFFDPSEFDLAEEEPPAPVQPVVKATLPPTSEPETLTFELPAGFNELDLFNFDGFQPQDQVAISLETMSSSPWVLSRRPYPMKTLSFIPRSRTERLPGISSADYWSSSTKPKVSTPYININQLAIRSSYLRFISFSCIIILATTVSTSHNRINTTVFLLYCLLHSPTLMPHYMHAHSAMLPRLYHYLAISFAFFYATHT